jgi:DNA-binding GntR family transcriptional regulator
MRVAAEVRDRVADGSLVPGEPIPSITAMSRQHGCSRTTVGKGLRVLEREGLLCRVRGLVYYVNSESLSWVRNPAHSASQ